MKNATKHADALKALHKKLAKTKSPEAPSHDPITALVHGVLSQDTPDDQVAAAVAAFNEEFVDNNELRVATELEVIMLVGEDFPQIDEKAMQLRGILNAIFEKEHILTLDRLKELNKRDARAALRELPGMTPYVEAYVSLIAFENAAMPIDETTHQLLLESDAIEEDASPEDVQKFIEGNLKVDEVWPLFSAIRAAHHNAGKARVKKPKPVAAPAKRTTAKK